MFIWNIWFCYLVFAKWHFLNSCKSVSNAPFGFCSVSKFSFLPAIRLTDIWELMQKLKRKEFFPGICYYIPLDHNIVYISVILLILWNFQSCYCKVLKYGKKCLWKSSIFKKLHATIIFQKVSTYYEIMANSLRQVLQIYSEIWLPEAASCKCS